jgi:hypothetical protein
VIRWLLVVQARLRLGGGVLLLLVVFARPSFPGGSAGVGILYAARGLGSATRALPRPLARRRVAAKPCAAILAAFLCAGLFYVGFSFAPSLLLAVLALIRAHVGGSILWVFSFTLLQMAVPDRFRGRVFAAEWALVTLSMSVSSFLTGRAIDVRTRPPHRPRAGRRLSSRERRGRPDELFSPGASSGTSPPGAAETRSTPGSRREAGVRAGGDRRDKRDRRGPACHLGDRVLYEVAAGWCDRR